jgi:hypothetical protein
MNKKSPIELFHDRIETLHKGENLLLQTVINHDPIWLKEKVLEYCQNKIHKTEFKIFFENKIATEFYLILSDIEKIVFKTRDLYPIDHPLYLFNVLKGGQELDSDERKKVRQFLQAEFDYYCLMLEVLLEKQIAKPQKQKIKTKKIVKLGRKSSIPSFKGSIPFSDEQLNKFYDILLQGRNLEELFEDAGDSRSQFIEIMKSDDVSVFSQKNYKIKLAAENYIFAFVLTWFEKNGFMKSAFKAVEESSSFCSRDDKKLIANDLSKTKSTYRIEKNITIISRNKKHKPSLPLDPQNNDQYFPFLNSLMHSTFS